MPDATRPQTSTWARDAGTPRVGLFIDCENQSHARLTEIIETASTEEGRLVVRRAYADWIDEAGGDWHAACIANGFTKCRRRHSRETRTLPTWPWPLT